MRLSLVAILLCSMAFATTGDNTETCAESDGSCPVKKRSVVYADYAPEKDSEEEAQEDVNDPDMVMHMQMRLNIEVPVDTEAAAPLARQDAPHGAHKLNFAEGSSRPHPQVLTGVTIAHAALGGAKLPETREILVDVPVSSLTAAAERSVPETAPASFYSSNQLLLGACIGAFLVVAGAVLALVVRKGMDLKNKSRDEMKTAGKAWMLDWALGYDPEKEDDEEEMVNPVESQLKLYPKKKQPPMANDTDSGNSTDEEEPEAESEDATAEMLEDAVYVAEQVEEANQAIDTRGYGFDQIQGSADQIQLFKSSMT